MFLVSCEGPWFHGEGVGPVLRENPRAFLDGYRSDSWLSGYTETREKETTWYHFIIPGEGHGQPYEERNLWQSLCCCAGFKEVRLSRVWF